MLQYLNWPCLEDAQLVMVYKITNEDVAITKKINLSHHWDNRGTFILLQLLSLLVRLIKNKNRFTLGQYLTETEFHSP